MSDPDRQRAVAYLGRALPRRLAELGIDWPVWLDADPERIRAGIRRGALRISVDQKGGGQVPASLDPEGRHRSGRLGRWWEPLTKEQADTTTMQLAGRLARWHREFADADDTGRIRRVVWSVPGQPRRHALRQEDAPGGEPIALIVEPGWFLRRAPLDVWAVLCPIEPGGTTSPGGCVAIAKALETGVVSVADGPPEST